MNVKDLDFNFMTSKDTSVKELIEQLMEGDCTFRVGMEGGDNSMDIFKNDVKYTMYFNSKFIITDVEIEGYK